MKNANLIIGAGVAIVLIVVLFLVLGNQGENYSMFPEFLTEPSANFAPAAAAMDAQKPVHFAPAAAAMDAQKPAHFAPAAAASMLSPAISQAAARAPGMPPATVASCKSLLKVFEPNPSAFAKIKPDAYDKGTRDMVKQLLAGPNNLPGGKDVRLVIPQVKLKNLIAAAAREAYDAGTVTGFAMTAKVGSLVTKQQMNQLKIKANKTRDLELMSFAGRADKLADTLSDVSAKLVSSAKPVCYLNPAGSKYPLYNTIEDPNAPFGSFIPAVTKILSDMNNGGDPFFFTKDMKALSDKFLSRKC